MKLINKNILPMCITYMVENPLRVIFVSLLIGLAFVDGMLKFEITSSTREYLGEDQPRIKSLIQLEAEYIEDLNIFVMLLPDEGNAFSKDVIQAIHHVTEQAWNIPHVKRVDSITNFQHTEVDGDDLTVSDLVENPDSLTVHQLQNIKTIALNEPPLVGSLIARDGRAAGINITFDLDLSNIESIRAASDAVREIKQQLAVSHPNIEMYQAGYVYMLDGYNMGAGKDVKYVFSLSVAIMFFGLLYFFRNVRATCAVLTIGILPMLIGLGLVGYLDKGFNAGTVLCTLMVLVLGLADGIHVTKSVRRLLGEGHDTREAIKRAVISNFTPIILTSITTAVGFLTFNFSGYSGIAIMGNYVAFGVICAFILSITLLPALLCYCGLKPETEKSASLINTRIADFVVKCRYLSLFFVLPSAISIFFIFTLEFDERTTRYLRADQDFTISLNKIQSDLTGATTMLYNFNSGIEGGVSRPDFMEKVDAFSQWLRQQPEVRHVNTYTDTMKRLNQNLHGGDTEYYRLPSQQDLAAQYLLLYELSLPYGLDLTNQINLDKSGTRLVISTDDLTIAQTKTLIARNTAWLEKNAPAFNTFANSDSITLLLAAGESMETLLASGVTALFIIGILLLFTFRSILAGVVCVFCVMSPILMAYGLWAILVGRVGMSGAMAVCMVIGISVDFSVHFISKFLHARRQLKLDAEDSVRYAFKLVSAPILTSVIVLGGGFAMLMLSVFEYNIVMGSLTAMCIVFAAVSALLFAPSILLNKRFSIK